MLKLTLSLILCSLTFSCISNEYYQSDINRIDNVVVDHKFPINQDAWYHQPGQTKLIELERTKCGAEANVGQAVKQALLVSFVNKFSIHAPGTTAYTKITETTPVFFTRYNPENLTIARMQVDSVRNRRFINLVNNRNANTAYVDPVADNVNFNWAKTQNGKYKIIVTTPLEKGEYGIFSAKDNKYYVFSFKKD